MNAQCSQNNDTKARTDTNPVAIPHPYDHYYLPPTSFCRNSWPINVDPDLPCAMMMMPSGAFCVFGCVWLLPGCRRRSTGGPAVVAAVVPWRRQSDNNGRHNNLSQAILWKLSKRHSQPAPLPKLQPGQRRHVNTAGRFCNVRESTCMYMEMGRCVFAVSFSHPH